MRWLHLLLPPIRVLAVTLAGSLIAGSMFWVLNELIGTTLRTTDFVEAKRIEFSRMRRDTEIVSKREEKPEHTPPPPMPLAPRTAFTASGSVERNVARLSPVLDVRGALSGLHLAAGSDRDVIPLVRIAPDYPLRALTRGIEGWVKVEFTISASGSVKNAKVVAAEPKNIFDDAALKAILRWRYNPRIEGGVAVERVGVQTIIRFKLEG